MRPTAILRNPTEPEATPKRARGILAEIGEMLTYIRHDKLLTTLILVVAAVNLLFTALFALAGALLTVTALLAATNSNLRSSEV